MRHFSLKKFTTCSFILAGVLSSLASAVDLTGPRYLVDTRGGHQAYVVAYESLLYTIDGGEHLNIDGSSVDTLDLSGAAGDFAEIRLSSNEGYVVSVANNIDYVSNNSSNDHMILARGVNGYVDTEFLVYNHIPIVNFQSPAKLVITAQQNDAEVTVLDMSDGSDDGIFLLDAGKSSVVALSDPSLLRITATANVSVYYGIISDGAVEVMPTANGGLYGTEAFVATPGFIGVVSGGEGKISIIKKISLGDISSDRILLERDVVSGEALFVPEAHTNSSAPLFGGVTTVRVIGTTQFYVFAGMGTAVSAFNGGTFLPPVPGEDGMKYDVVTLHTGHDSEIDVAPLDDGTTMTVSQIENGSVVSVITASATVDGVSTYTLPESNFRVAGINDGIAKYTYRVDATGPVAVQERHVSTVERGGLAISPDYEPQVKPSVGRLDVTAVRIYDDFEDASPDDRLRVVYTALDVNGDLTSVVVTDPNGQPIDLLSYVVTVPGAQVGQFDKQEVDTKWTGIEYAYIPGTYTLTATDALGNVTVRIDSVRDLSGFDITATRVSSPDHEAWGVDLRPIYSWMSPRFEFPSHYRFEVSNDVTLTDPDSTIISLEDVHVEGAVSAAHGTWSNEPLDINSDYGWRVMSVASTLRFGDDFAVLGPTWTFNTSEYVDTEPPVFSGPPRVSGVTIDTVRIQWDTNEPTTGELRVFELDGTPVGNIPDSDLKLAHLVRTIVGKDRGLLFKLVVEATDQNDNTTISDTLVFRIETVPDTEDPRYLEGPAHVSVTHRKATLRWRTTEPAAYQVHYWIYGVNPLSQPDQILKEAELEELEPSWQVDLLNLLADTVYFYQVQAIDASNNVGYSPIIGFRTQAEPDRTAPLILGRPAVNDRTSTSAKVNFSASEASIGGVRYGLARNDLRLAATNTEAGLVTIHEVALARLDPATVYYYRATATDASGNVGGSDTLSFTTLALPDNDGPTIQPRGQGGVNQGKVLISTGDRKPRAQWQTNEPSTGTVTVATDSTRNASGRFANTGTFINVWTVTLVDATDEQGKVYRVLLDGLADRTRYFAQIVAKDKVGNTTVGVPIEFTTQSATVDEQGPVGGALTISPGGPLRLGNSVSLTVQGMTDPSEPLSYAFQGKDPQSSTGWITLAASQQRNSVTVRVPAPVQVSSSGSPYLLRAVVTDAVGNPANLTKEVTILPVLHRTYYRPFMSRRYFRPFTRRRWRSKPAMAAAEDSTSISSVWIEFETDVPTTYEAFVFEVPATTPIIPTQMQIGTVASQIHRLVITGLSPGIDYGWAVVLSTLDGETTVVPEGTEIARLARGVQITKVADGRGSSFATSVTPDESPPEIINGPTVVSKNGRTVTVNWETDEPSDSRLRFRLVPPASVKLAEGDEGEDEQELVVTEVTTSHTVTFTVSDDGSFEYESGSTDLGGNGETTLPGTFNVSSEPDTETPKIIEGPSVISRTHDRAVIKWVTNESADGQVDILERGEPLENRSTFTASETGVEHIVTVTNLSATTVYDFLISSYDLAGNGPTTGLSEFQTLDLPDTEPPVVTVAPHVVSVDDVSAKLAWTTDEATDSYVEYGTTLALGIVVQNTQRSLEHELVLTNLLAGTKYYYQITAEDAAGNVLLPLESDSLVTVAQPDLEPPSVPQGLATIAGDGQISVSWQANVEDDFSGFNLERSTNGVDFVPVITGLPVAQYLDAPVENSVGYTYRVASVDASRSRNQSEWVVSSVTTPDAGLSLDVPVVGPYYFLYYNLETKEGELFRPVFRVENVPEVQRPGAVMSYQFSVAADVEFTDVLITSAPVAPGDSIIGTRETWTWSWMGVPEAQRRYDLLETESDSTTWIPTRSLTPGQNYYWKVRASDGTFNGAWSSIQQFNTQAAILLLDPRRADHFNIDLTPETPQQRPVDVAIDLAAFAADGVPGGVRVDWSVHVDGEAEGVILTRAVSADGPFMPITGVLPLDAEFLDVGAVPSVTYWYSLLVPLSNGDQKELGLASGAMALPTKFAIKQNHPNPFNPTTVIPYTLPAESEISVTIYDVTGRIVRELVRAERQGAGWYSLTWDGTDNVGRHVGSGIYLYHVVRVQTERSDGVATVETRVGRMSLVK
jgi:hypothetical protein